MMKKKFFLILTLAAVFFGSCVNENENPAPLKAGETVDVKFRVGLQTSPGTRASDQSGYSNIDPSVYSLRYKVAVYEGDKSSPGLLTLQYTDSVLVDVSSGVKQQEFSFPLVSGMTYTVVGWADFVDKVTNVATSVDKFYDTSDFPNITLKDEAFTFNEEAKDAYFGVWSGSLADAVINVPLKRPFGKIRLLVSDYKSDMLTGKDKANLVLSSEYTAAYLDATGTSTIYTTLDMLTGDVSGNADGTQRGYYPVLPIDTDTAQRRVETNGELTVFWDYILAPSIDQISAGAENKPQIKFEVNYQGTKYDGKETINPDNVPYVDPRIVIERNKLTTVRINLFGEEPTKFIFSIEDAFTDELEPLLVHVVYTDGETSTINVARDADGVGSFKCPKTVRYISINGTDSIFIGTTKAFQTVTLKFGADDKIVFRDPVAPSTSIPVNSIAELQLIKTNATTLGGRYVLTDNLDLLSKEWTPIGSNATPFTGRFNGDGHTVRNLKISSGSYRGFFGDNSGSTIENLGVLGSVSGGNEIGGVAGKTNGTIAACSFDGTVTGNNHVGGLVGNATMTSARITACRSVGAVTGNSMVGGLVGYSASGRITACYSSSTVTGSSLIGGLLGAADNSTLVTACHSGGTATGTGTGNYIGGLVGSISSAGIVTACYSTATSGSADFGSLYGGNSGTANIIGCFTNGPLLLETDITLFGDGIVPGTGWPSTTASAEWGIGGGLASGQYWINLGGWNSGSPVYPKLLGE